MAFSEEILIRMGFDNRKVDRGLRSTKQKAKETANSVSASFKKVGTSIAAAFSIGAITKFFNEIRQFADEIGTKAKAIGVSAEFLQRFGYAAEQSGIATEKANVALGKLVQKVGQAKELGGEYAKMFDTFGINIYGRSADEVLEDVAKLFQELPDQASRAGVAMKLFEEGGADLVTLLQQGPEGLKKLMGEAVVMTDEQVDAIDRVDKAIKRLKQTLKMEAGGFTADVISGAETVSETGKSGERAGMIRAGLSAFDAIMRSRGIPISTSGAAGGLSKTPETLWKINRSSGILGFLANIGSAGRSEEEAGKVLDAQLAALNAPKEAEAARRAGAQPPNFLGPYPFQMQRSGNWQDPGKSLEEIVREMREGGLPVRPVMGE